MGFPSESADEWRLWLVKGSGNMVAEQLLEEYEDTLGYQSVVNNQELAGISGTLADASRVAGLANEGWGEDVYVRLMNVGRFADRLLFALFHTEGGADMLVQAKKLSKNVDAAMSRINDLASGYNTETMAQVTTALGNAEIAALRLRQLLRKG